MANVTFFLNGQPVTVKDPSADLLLIDYLRSPEVALAGPKKGCGQGGCGACTVILSSWNREAQEPEHRAINSCLHPVCSLGGLAVTTVEGTGAARTPNPPHLAHTAVSTRSAMAPSTEPPPQFVAAARLASGKRAQVRDAVQAALVDRSAATRPGHVRKEQIALTPVGMSFEGMNPVAYQLATNNGSQCGYCSVGFVMNMTEFLINHRSGATKAEIEAALDGHICRCTGYRPILTAMKTFASDWSKDDEASRMRCLLDDDAASQVPGPLVIPFPKAAEQDPLPYNSPGGDRAWYTPATLDELADLVRNKGPKRLRLVNGNTSFGVYPDEYWSTDVLVDLRLIRELRGPSTPEVGDDQLHVPAGTTYGDFITLLEAAIPQRYPDPKDPQRDTSHLAALLLMARRTAGRIVRNAASLGGNTMMVLQHIAPGTGSPFPSDLCTALVAVGAEIEYLTFSQRQTRREPLAALIAKVDGDPQLAGDILLLGYRVPLGTADDVTLSQKVALRDVNSHTIVNATTRFSFGPSGSLCPGAVTLIFGGIAPMPWRPTAVEDELAGADLSLAALPPVIAKLEQAVRAELARWAGRMAGLPDEGFTDDYRVALVVSLFYKAVIHALAARGAAVPAELASAGVSKWGTWPVSNGTQRWDAASEAFKAPVAQPYIKNTAIYQCSGQQHYTHELPVPPRTVNAAFVVSTRALADYRFITPGHQEGASSDDLRAHLLAYAPDTFVDLVTHEAIKDGGINYQGMAGDQPLFAESRVSYVGQSIALVLATTEQEAIRIARYVTRHCIGYRGVAWPAPFDKPIIGIEQAIEANSIYPDSPETAVWNSHIWQITRPGSRFDWAADLKPLDRPSPTPREVTVDGAPCLVVESAQRCGGQAHFYMETQACIAEPADGRRMIIHSSTQSPMAQHSTAAAALGVQYHRIDVRIAPVGGGFGGKTEQTKFVVGPTAVAAHAVKRPVRLVMPREEDTAMIGKRHAYYGQSQVAIDRDGILRGMQTKMWGDGGAFYDCSFIVSNCIQLRADNAYYVGHFQNQIDIVRTNTAPSTAFRAFGDVQGKNILENAIDEAATAIGMRPEEVRGLNLYQRGQVTPFGQALTYCYMREVWEYLLKESRYELQLRAVNEFNSKNKWRKRGLAVIPVKYGSGYNLTQLEQAACYIAVNHADGSVLVHQGGVEIGQGLTTQVLQVASYILNVPTSLIRIENVSTSVMPNATSTGGSTGTPYNAEVVKQTSEKLQARLMAFGYRMLKEQGNAWCKKNGIDFWSYPDTGWNTQLPDSTTLIWQKLVALAYSQRVDLTCSFTAPIRGGETPVPAFTYKDEGSQPSLPGIAPGGVKVGGEVDSFVGFTYSAACSMVEVDILTGEVKLLTADLVYDMGRSMNPAIDIGQVEGAFMQGVGYLLTEKLVFEEGADNPDVGRLNSVNTWNYKPPASTSVPLELNVHLFPRSSVPYIPEDPSEVFSAKEVGEPPLVLANSVFFAVKDAVRASRVERGLSPLFRMDAPATVAEVRRACDVSIDHLAG